ncbi:MAG TPA: type II toxin-antitoxin system VapC family toxin [Candidatus Tyrphobacter sp.]
MNLVVDASSALAWSIEDERDDQAEALLHRVVREGAIVPAIWPFEIQNGLRNAVRRRRITEADAQAITSDMADLPIRIADASERPQFHGVLDLAFRFELSVYDAAYVDVALRHDGRLVTRDARLAEVARSLGVAMIAKTIAKGKRPAR